MSRASASGQFLPAGHVQKKTPPWFYCSVQPQLSLHSLPQAISTPIFSPTKASSLPQTARLCFYLWNLSDPVLRRADMIWPLDLLCSSERCWCGMWERLSDAEKRFQGLQEGQEGGAAHCPEKWAPGCISASSQAHGVWRPVLRPCAPGKGG